jgi:hypothetical protein
MPMIAVLFWISEYNIWDDFKSYGTIFAVGIMESIFSLAARRTSLTEGTPKSGAASVS